MLQVNEIRIYIKYECLLCINKVEKINKREIMHYIFSPFQNNLKDISHSYISS